MANPHPWSADKRTMATEPAAKRAAAGTPAYIVDDADELDAMYERCTEQSDENTRLYGWLVGAAQDLENGVPAADVAKSLRDAIDLNQPRPPVYVPPATRPNSQRR